VRGRNRFETGQVFGKLEEAAAPIVGRVQMLWESMRGAVLDVFPKAPGLPKDKGNYLMICGGNLQERRLSLAVYRRLFDKEDAPK